MGKKISSSRSKSTKKEAPKKKSVPKQKKPAQKKSVEAKVSTPKKVAAPVEKVGKKITKQKLVQKKPKVTKKAATVKKATEKKVVIKKKLIKAKKIVKVEKRIASKPKIVKKKAEKPKKSEVKQPAPERVVRPKVAKKQFQPLGYSADQFQKFQKYVNELQQWTNNQLKDALKKNQQSSTGNKDELILKVADGKVLGAIPRCPSCFGGRPRFDYISGMYRCPGYRDDEDFVNCNRTYNLGDLTRTSWEE